MQAR
ncbi:UNVERIFIED_CONTAM: hypothetical protein GTU68_027870 [Idotea baltica]|jgi:lysosomal alpha-mannosidase